LVTMTASASGTRITSTTNSHSVPLTRSLASIRRCS
jgi:hypothetical protein